MNTQKRLIETYQKAQKKLVAIIQRKQAYGNSTAYERSLLKQINKELKKLRKASQQLVSELVKQSYKDGLQSLIDDLISDPNAPILHNMMSGLNTSQIEIIVQNTNVSLNNAINLVGRQIQDIIREAGIEATAEKLTAGQTVREMQKSLEKKLLKQDITSVKYRNGKTVSIHKYTAMVARSTTAEAQNKAKTVQGQDWGYDLVRLTEHSPTCEVCAMYQGRVYALTKEAANGKYKGSKGQPLRFPYLYDTVLPNGYSTIHPNCRHRLSILPAGAYTAAEMEDFSRKSMQPFEDMRSDQERKAYAKEQEVKRKRNESRKQYEKIKTALPNDAPKTFAAFVKMKSAKSERYKELLKDYRTVMGIAKQQESGISGKQVTKSSENSVNLDYISSKEYHNKFKGITNNRIVDEQIYTQSKAMLTHRNGTDKEDMCLIDSSTGKIVGRQSSSQSDFGIEYNDSLINAIAQNPPNTLISIHNHPTNNPPTGSDFVSNGRNKYKLGIVVTHDGKVFIYKAGKQPFTATSFGKTVDKYRGEEYNLSEYDAIIKTLEEYRQCYGIEWSERL